jgi:predicted dehydrogenase
MVVMEPGVHMSSDVIRVGIVGAGANTVSRHIPGLQAISGVALVSVANRSRASSERVARRFGIPQVYDDWRTLVEAPDTDAIVIGTWPYMHCPVTLAAIAARKHVLCEARMAMNVAEASRMRDAALAEPRVVAQLVPAPGTLRVDRTIMRLIAEGYLGDLLAVNVRDGNSFIDRDSPLHWRQNTDLSGLNVMTLGIWYEQVMRWAGEATRVTAMGRTFARLRRDEAGRPRTAQVPDHVDVVAELTSGAQAHFQISAVTGLAGETGAFLFGSEGTLRIASNRLFGGRRGATQLEEITITSEEEGGWRVEEEWINAIRGREPVRLTTFEDGVKYMAFTEAVTRSIATGSTVPVLLARGD